MSTVVKGEDVGRLVVGENVGAIVGPGVTGLGVVGTEMGDAVGNDVGLDVVIGAGDGDVVSPSEKSGEIGATGWMGAKRSSS